MGELDQRVILNHISGKKRLSITERKNKIKEGALQENYMGITREKISDILDNNIIFPVNIVVGQILELFKNIIIKI